MGLLRWLYRGDVVTETEDSERLLYALSAAVAAKPLISISRDTKKILLHEDRPSL